MAAARLAAASAARAQSVGVGACARCGVGGARGGGALGLRVRGSLVEERSRLASPEGVEPRLGVRRGARGRFRLVSRALEVILGVKRARHDARAGKRRGGWGGERPTARATRRFEHPSSGARATIAGDAGRGARAGLRWLAGKRARTAKRRREHAAARGREGESHVGRARRGRECWTRAIHPRI